MPFTLPNNLNARFVTLDEANMRGCFCRVERSAYLMSKAFRPSQGMAGAVLCQPSATSEL
jgi:hypothetical protein